MKVGKIQLALLKVLSDRERGWIDRPYGCGWVWSTPAFTRRVLESLVKKGLVDKGLFKSDQYPSGIYPQYTVSTAGRNHLKEIADAD